MIGGELQAAVTIIGGGIVGVCAAFHLARRGTSAVLLERGAVGAQASGVNFGGLRTNGRAEAELPLSLRARSQWQDIEALIGHHCEVAVTGHLELCVRPEQMSAVETWAAMARRHGVDSTLLSGREIAARFPWIGVKALGGCFVAEDGAANPRLAAPRFALAARALGATIIEHDPVRQLEHDGNDFRVETESGRKVRSPALVLCAGAWSAKLASQIGDDFPLSVTTPQMIVSEPFRHTMSCTVDCEVGGRFFYSRQIARGNLLFGRGHGRCDFENGRAQFVPENAFGASRAAIDILPCLKGRTMIRCWSGIEGRSPDSLPFLGFSRKVPRLIHAFGFSGHGFQLGPGTGSVIADLVINGHTATAIQAFDPYRFGKPLMTTHHPNQS